MFKLGDRVQMSDDALDNYGEKYRGKTLIVTHVATKYMPATEFFAKGQPAGYHPGFDDAGGALYDLRFPDDKPLPMSLYDWELKSAPGKRRR